MLQDAPEERESFLVGAAAIVPDERNTAPRLDVFRVGYIVVLITLVVAWLASAPVQVTVVAVAVGLALSCADPSTPPCLSVIVIAGAVVALFVVILQVTELSIVHVDRNTTAAVLPGRYLWFFPAPS